MREDGILLWSNFIRPSFYGCEWEDENYNIL